MPCCALLRMCAYMAKSIPGDPFTAAQLMGDSGEVIALDRTHAKVAGIMDLAKDFGLTCVRAIKVTVK